MSRKRVHKILSAALGLLAFGSSSGMTSATRTKVDRSGSEIFHGKSGDSDAEDLLGKGKLGNNTGDGNNEDDDMGGYDTDVDELPYGGEDEEMPEDGDLIDDVLLEKDRNEIADHLDDRRGRINELQAGFLDASSRWGEICASNRVRASLQTSYENINKLIKTAGDQKREFDKLDGDVSRMISGGKGRIAILDTMDKVDRICEGYASTVDQLIRAISSYEASLGTATKADEVADTQKRRANAALLNSMRNSVADYLKKVRLAFTDFTDVKGRLDKVNAVSSELSELRRQLDSKLDSGVGDDEYNDFMKKMQEMKKTLADIERSVREDRAVYSRETDHSRLNQMLFEVSQMWGGFSKDCNPRKLSAAGMSRDSVEQCQQFYKMVMEHYVNLRKTIREKIAASINTVSSALSPEIDNFYKKEMDEFNSKIANCKHSFDSVQKFEAARQVQMSPAEHRQKKNADFIDEARDIRNSGELTLAEMLDGLVAALSKILPGRAPFHRKLLEIFSTPIQMDSRGEIDSTSLLAHNVLLIGSPGNGKTEELIAIANALGLKVIRANGDNFATEAASYAFYNDLVNETIQANSRFVIFFDEIDSIFTNRALDDQDGKHGAVTVFNNFIDNYLKKNPELIKKYAGMMATTNMAPKKIDDALLSRFQQRFHIPRFDEADARQFLRVELEPVSFTANTTKESLINTLANIMVNKQMDVRTALSVIDKVYAYAKSLSDNGLQNKPGAFTDSDIDVGVNDVIVDPSLMIAGFNGMELGSLKGRSAGGNAVVDNADVGRNRPRLGN